MVADVGVIRRALVGDVQGDFHVQAFGLRHQAVEIGEGAELRVNALVAAVLVADGPRAADVARLRALGVRHIRTAIWHDRPDQYSFIRSLGAAGIRFDVIAGDPTNRAGTPELLVATAAREFPRYIESFEGANEWNLSGRPNWAAEDRAHQQRLYAAVKSTPAVASVPVLAPSLGMRKDRDVLGDHLARLRRSRAVVAEPDPLVQIFANLLRNAAQAVPPGSSIGIAAHHDADRVAIEVWDSGPGVPAELQHQIFNPFVTSKEGSMGLGLAVTERLVRGFGWTIGVGRREGRTIFRVDVPEDARALSRARAS